MTAINTVYSSLRTTFEAIHYAHVLDLSEEGNEITQGATLDRLRTGTYSCMEALVFPSHHLLYTITVPPIPIQQPLIPLPFTVLFINSRWRDDGPVS